MVQVVLSKLGVVPILEAVVAMDLKSQPKFLREMEEALEELVEIKAVSVDGGVAVDCEVVL